jgi:ankyrin repeat protein
MHRTRALASNRDGAAQVAGPEDELVEQVISAISKQPTDPSAVDITIEFLTSEIGTDGFGINSIIQSNKGGFETTLLYTAARSNNIQVADYLLNSGASPYENKPRKYGRHLGSKAASGETLVSLRGNSPLHAACFRGHQDMVKLLITRAKYPKSDNFPFDLVNDDGDLCTDFFMHGLDQSSMDAIRDFIFGPFYRDVAISKPLLISAAENPQNLHILSREIETYKFPVDQRIEIKAEDSLSLSTTLLYTAARANNAVGLNYLLGTCRADPNVRVIGGNTALHVASYRGYVEIVEILMAYHGNPELLNDIGETCTSVFHSGVEQSVKNRIVNLCKNVQHKCLEDKFAQTCASLEREAHDISALRQFLMQELDSINALLPNHDQTKTSLLYTASRAGNAAAVDLLLESGADPDLQVSGGNTSLMVSSSRNHRDVVTSLLQHGANPVIQNNSGKRFRPIDEDAMLAAHGRASLLVLDMWVEVNSARIDERLTVQKAEPTGSRASLLFEAARSNQIEAAKCLLDLGANPNNGDAIGNSPLHISCFLGFKAMVGILLNHNADVDCLNLAGEPVDSKKDSLVSHEIFAGIKEQIQQARALKRQELQELKLIHYVASLERRRIPGYPLAEHKLTKQLQHVKASTSHVKDAVLDLQRRVFSAFVSEISTKVRCDTKNPITAGLILNSAEAVYNVLWNSLEWADWCNAPERDLLPLKCGAIYDIFNQICSDTLKEFVKGVIADISQGTRSEIHAMIERDISVDNFRNISDQIFDALVKHAERKVLDSQFIGRIARYCIIQNNFELLRRDMPNEKKGLVDCHCIALLGTSKPFLQMLGNLMKGIHHGLIKQVAGRVLAAHLPPSSIHVNAYEKFKKKTISLLASNKGPVNTLHELDDLATWYLKESVDESVKKLLQTNSSCESAMVLQYAQKIVQKMHQSIDLNYKSKGEHLAENSQLFLDPPYSHKCIKRYLNNPEELEAFVLDVKAPSLITPACKTRFEDFCTAHVKTIRPRPSFNDSVREFLRPLHLNMLWCRMPCYAQLSDFMSDFQSSSILLIQADTGSGKSVLIPQYLAFHAKDLQIFVTQPRREPTTSIGTHVQSQYGVNDVGFQVAGMDNHAPRARLQYCTDGLLLQRVWSDTDMSDWCIIIDEIHERNMNMDMLFLLSMHRMKHGKGPKKIILASAKVDPYWFKNSVDAVNHCYPSANHLIFRSLSLDVRSPFKVTECVPPNGYLTWDPKKSLAIQSKLAAQHAMRLVVKDPSVKVLVFLTSPEEVRDSVTEFEKLSNKSISCCGIHAKAVGIHHSLQKSRVIFSNNIAETSLTIPALTHVVDFTTSTKVKIDRSRNELDLVGDRCSAFARLQRRGRLGRTAPGEYCAIYDPQHLQATTETSFDVLSNEHLLQCEMRVRYFLRSTLFKPPAPGLKTLGIGLADTQNICAMLPTDRTKLEIGATLNLTPAMTAAFAHAAVNPAAGECALAIIWLCAMLETREPPVPPRTPLPAQFRVGLGIGGDHGVLLQIYATYEAERIRPGFDLKQWCQANGDVQPSFLLSAEAQIKSLLLQCQLLYHRGSLGKDPATYQRPAAWTWDSIAEALLQG